MRWLPSVPLVGGRFCAVGPWYNLRRQPPRHRVAGRIIVLDPLVVLQVRALLRSTECYHSQRAIARICHVSRDSVRRIVNGTYPDYGAPTAERPEPRGPIRRCTTCGHKVELPCRICTVRRRLTGLGVQLVRSHEGPLSLNLRPADRQRYDERRQSGPAPEPVRTNDERQDAPSDPVYVHPLSDEAFLDAFAFDPRHAVPVSKN